MVIKMEVHHQLVPTSDLFPPSHTPLTDTIGDAGNWIPPLIPLTPPKLFCGNEPVVRGNGSKSFDSLDYTDLLVPGRVTASRSIPEGAMSINIEPWTLLGKIDVQQLSVEVTSYGTLDLDKKSKDIWTQGAHWIRAIRLSDDCHTYNVQLKCQPAHRFYPNMKGGPQPKLILQVVRPIEVGQELQLWFSEDILAMLQVVFLIPSNIQGQKKYTCTRCLALYESPNPLKLHITLDCGKLPTIYLWERLASLMNDKPSLRDVVPKIQDFEFKLTPEPPICRQRNALDLTIGVIPTNTNVKKGGIYRPYTNCSAFRPFKKPVVEINGNTPTLLNQSGIQNLSAVWPVTFETDVVQLHRNLMHNQALTNAQNIYSDDAQIESLVSSLGKAKQGHICLYCGKVYSRKYGLKIHIRTHTGYKPLRCKFCDRPFGDPSNLNKHVRLHAEGNTPYKCDLCGKILVRRRDLERHLKSRHMVEMHPGQNFLPGPAAAPAVTDNEENSNSLAEIAESDVTIIDENPESSNENINSLNETPEEISLINEKDQDMKNINLHKEESISDIDIDELS